MTTGIGVLLVVQLWGLNWEEVWGDIFGILPILAVYGGVLSLGIGKILCAWLIARGSRKAAWIALVIVGVESLAVLFCVIDGVISLIDGGYDDSIYVRGLVGLLACLVLTGWLAVDYEIVQVLRLEGKPTVLPPSRGESS